jgi:transcriptional regulator with XRE-family HTH domain
MISKKDFQLSVAWRLRVARRALDKTQAEFGSKLNVGVTAVSNYESNGRGFTPYSAYRLKEAYGLPLEWLYAGDEGALSANLAGQITKADSELRADEANKRKKRQKSA